MPFMQCPSSQFLLEILALPGLLCCILSLFSRLLESVSSYDRLETTILRFCRNFQVLPERECKAAKPKPPQKDRGCR